jgi:hypothetical protein
MKELEQGPSLLLNGLGMMKELEQALAKRRTEIESNPIRSLETVQSKENLSYVSSQLSVLEYTSEPVSVRPEDSDSPLPSPTTSCRTAALRQEKHQPRALCLQPSLSQI